MLLRPESQVSVLNTSRGGGTEGMRESWRGWRKCFRRRGRGVGRPSPSGRSGELRDEIWENCLLGQPHFPDPRHHPALSRAKSAKGRRPSTRPEEIA